MLTLDVAIATWKADGINRVVAMNLPRCNGVRYVVSWQAAQGLDVPAALLNRDDVSVYTTDVKGLSNNRNNAVEHCTADIVLHGDDDLTYTAEQLQAVRNAFEQWPDVEVATFRYEGEHTKCYPAVVADLAVMPKNYSVTMFEIAVRRNSAAGMLRCHPAFGPGSPFTASGEDEILLLTARRRGLNCKFFPITITTHHGPTTGSRRITNDRVLHGMGAVIRLTYGLSSLPRIVLKSFRMSRSGQCGLLKGLVGLLRGWHYAAKLTLD